MVHIVVWLVVGAVIGLVAGSLMRDNDDQSVFVNVIVGVVGALVAGWIVAPYFGLRAGDPRVLDFGAPVGGAGGRDHRAGAAERVSEPAPALGAGTPWHGGCRTGP